MRTPFNRELHRLIGPASDKFTLDDPLNSSAPQQLVTLALDRSSSMSGAHIEQVNRGAADFARELCQDAVTRDTVQVQLVTFGSAVEVQPFVPISRFVAPNLFAAGGTPLAEAMLKAIEDTERHSEFLRTAAEVDVLKPHYFLFSDGCPTSPPRLIREAAAWVRQRERTRQGAFYGFGVNQAAVQGLQPLFIRPVHLLGEHNFAEFFRIISVSVRRVSSVSACEDVDLTPVINHLLRIPYTRNRDA